MSQQSCFCSHGFLGSCPDCFWKLACVCPPSVRPDAAQSSLPRESPDPPTDHWAQQPQTGGALHRVSRPQKTGKQNLLLHAVRQNPGPSAMASSGYTFVYSIRSCAVYLSWVSVWFHKPSFRPTLRSHLFICLFVYLFACLLNLTIKT